MKGSYRNLELPEILSEVALRANFSSTVQRIEESEPNFSELIWKRNLKYLKEAMTYIQESGPLFFFFRKEMATTFRKASKGSLLHAQELYDVAQFFALVASVLNYFKKSETKSTELKDLYESLVKEEVIERQLRNMVSPEGEILDSASATLKNIRFSMTRNEQAITNVAQDFIAKHSEQVVDGVITVRANRTLILVKAGYKNSFGGYVYGDSSSGLTSYVEPNALVALNNQRIALLDAQEEEMNRILKEGSDLVKSVAHQSLANLSTLQLLDEIFAKAYWSIQKDACVPKLSHQKELYLKKVRHPLIDAKKVIANTYVLKEPNHMVLITGSNTGGKTVSLKVIGLSILLSACGIGVLAEEAVIPMVDEVYVDIGDDQSVVSSLSSFSAHMSKQAYIIEHIQEKSLVLLDEIGNGTDPKEGEAIAIAILNHLRQVGCITFATTHYDRLKAYGKRHKDIILASVLFNMETLLPTYQYKQGLTGSSNAFAVAERYGLPKSIVNYAKSLKEQAKTEEDRLIETLDAQKSALEQEREQFQVEKQLFLSRYKELHAKENALLEAKQRFEKEKQEALQQVYQQYEKKAQSILEQLKEKDLKYHEALTLKKKMDTPKFTEPLEGLEKRSFQVGDAVELLSSKQVGQIIKIEKKRLTVELNGREYQVKENQLRHSFKQIPKKKTERVFVQSAGLFQASIPSEVNLIGLTVEEGVHRLDDFLDKVKISHFHQVRIIHGDGSGKLRQAVHQRLSKMKMVDSFRLGMPNEGGTGATVVILK
ncbi:endonuclease MutS2 [Bulleidia sp. zg-1006]|uniref:endonuclease MutS2 n=1 Tax=Bulleidia sp. zg-1006 TaxID=2806552 RepID=UPI0019399917|nr:Smr/MutS family protein [Bulleidia sp. zg-1006]QRG87415.1 Smr/MutS family protein [Bulleidia sp. zg-1006]